MVDLTEFLEALEEIQASGPSYREGGTGQDGTCDCVGLLMGSLMRCGVKSWPMHSSNWFARYAVDELLPLEDAQIGCAVFKSRDGSQTLNSRYLEGGRYWTGDTSDYYHIGVVVSLDPVQIMHCTSSGNVNGITVDGSFKGWSCCGWISTIRKEVSDMVQTGVVVAADGGSVRIRQKPDRKSVTIGKVPTGSQVQVVAVGDGWTTVEYNGLHGYMMREFVQMQEQQEEQEQQAGKLDIIIDLLTAILDRLSE